MNILWEHVCGAFTCYTPDTVHARNMHRLPECSYEYSSGSTSAVSSPAILQHRACAKLAFRRGSQNNYLALS